MRENFTYGALVLLLTNLLNRLLAFFYRIFIVRLLGAEGVGLYEMVFPIYSLILVVTTAGLPLAVAKLTAEKVARGDLGQARRTFLLAAGVLFFSGLFSALALWYASPLLATRVLADSRAYKALVMTVPALFIVPVCSAFRGLFQGAGRLSRPAFSQVAEQVVRVSVGLYLARLFLPHGLDYAAAGLVAGMVAGEMAGFAYLFLAYWREKPLAAAAGRTASMGLFSTWKELWHFGFPVTVGRIVGAIILALEAVLIPQRLQVAGYSLRQATELYGQFSGIALTLLHLPTVLTLSLATTMVPAVAEAMAKNQARVLGRRIRDALRLTVVGGLPFTVLYALFPAQLTHILFANASAGEVLKVLAWGGLFLYLQQTSTGILQGLGRTDLAMRNSLVGAAITLGGIYWLTAMPAYGIRGAAFSVVVSGIVACYLNLGDIARQAGLVISWQPLGKSLVAALAMGLVSYNLYRLFWRYTPLPTALAGAIAVGLAVYLLLSWSLGVLSRRDFARLPWLAQWFGN